MLTSNRPKLVEQESKPTGNSDNVLDDSLTSLAWLHNLNLTRQLHAIPTPPSSPATVWWSQPDDRGRTGACMAGGHGLNNSTAKSTGVRCSEPAVVRVGHADDVGRHVKPPYSYATLISMAINSSPERKLTLSGIYRWISDKFTYYRYADQSWQNSIRHNLSLNKYFQKLPRAKEGPGKGGFWRVNPQYQNLFDDDGMQRKRPEVASTICDSRSVTGPQKVGGGRRLSQKEWHSDYDELFGSAAVKRLKTESTNGCSNGGEMPLSFNDCMLTHKVEPTTEISSRSVWPPSSTDQLLDGQLNLSWSFLLEDGGDCLGASLEDRDVVEALMGEDFDNRRPGQSPLSPPSSDTESGRAMDQLLSSYFADVDEFRGFGPDLGVSGASIAADPSTCGRRCTLPPVSTLTRRHHPPFYPLPHCDVILGGNQFTTKIPSQNVWTGDLDYSNGDVANLIFDVC